MTTYQRLQCSISMRMCVFLLMSANSDTEFSDHVPFHNGYGAQYDEVTGNEAFAEDFQQAMTYFTKLSLRGGEVSLKDAFDWKTSKCIMDVGGGRGECLSHCMLHAGPGCRGVLMDRPWVLDRCTN